ncbi:MAG: methyltransferase domain-containing protein [Chitinispirillia bacterium]|nr:methyltransferase domain-containing protein [Chitinispirillia bacterium]
MKFIDKMLQKWRISKALRHIPASSRVLDIGCFYGELFVRAGSRLRGGLGIDPTLTDSVNKNPCDNVTLIKGIFPEDMPPEAENFDIITCLAVFEHIPNETLSDFITACHDRLNPDGRIILTVPSPFVDAILAVLLKMRLIDGMSLDEHHGLLVEDIPALFEKGGFALIKKHKFQLGLNNIFVFQKGELPMNS